MNLAGLADQAVAVAVELHRQEHPRRVPAVVAVAVLVVAAELAEARRLRLQVERGAVHHRSAISRLRTTQRLRSFRMVLLHAHKLQLVAVAVAVVGLVEVRCRART